MPARMVASALVQIAPIEFRVRFFSATRQTKNREPKLAFLHAADNGRLVQRSQCTVCNEFVSQENTVRGHEHAKDEYVVLTAEDQKQLDALTPGTISIDQFVPSSAVDLVQIEKSFYLSPELGAEAAFHAFHDTMTESGLWAVGVYAAHRRKTLVCIRAKNGVMVLHQLRDASEVVPASDVPKSESPAVSSQERAAVRRLVDSLRREQIERNAASDGTQDRIAQFLDAKARKETAAEEGYATEVQGQTSNAVDHRNALQRAKRPSASKLDDCALNLGVEA